ncbi:MAG: MarR family transcriptional regulator, partial [Aeromicrobium sp.]
YVPTDAHQIGRAVARMNRRLRQERQSELTPTQLSVLGSVRRLRSATPSAIAARERVQPPSITRTLSSLAEAGLIVREPHPEDGRQVLISVSDEGLRVLDEENGRRDLWLSHRLADLTVAERTTVREAAALLERLAQS